MVRDAVDIEVAARTAVAGFDPVQPATVIRRSRSGPVLACRRSGQPELYGLKWLVPSLAFDAGAIRRIKSDIDRIAATGHRGIVQIDALHQVASGVVVVSDVVEAATLRAILSEGTLSDDAVAALAVDLMETVAWIHNAGVLHRDITADSVLIDKSGNSFLVDVGIAAPVYALGGPSGTPAYIAPELWNDAHPSQAADFYALATVLYEACVGQAPFAGRRVAAVRAKHLRGHPDLTLLPDRIRDGIAVGLERDASVRPTSAAQWRQDLRSLANLRLEAGWEERGRQELASCSLAASSSYPSAVVAGAAAGEATAVAGARREWRRVLAGGATAALLLVAAGVWALTGLHGGSPQALPTPKGSTLAVATPQDSYFATLTPAPTVTPTPTPSPTPHQTPRPVPPPLGISTPTPCPTSAPTPTPSATPTATPSPTPTPTAC